MPKKNPNQTGGIRVTVRKAAHVRLPLPCQRLHRRLVELLQKAKVRSTEYMFTVQDTQKILVSLVPAVSVANRTDTTLEFTVTIILPNGELFVGNLKAPVKCSEDGLATELARAAAEINKSGWHETEADKSQAAPRHISPVLTGRRKLIKDILELLQGFDVQIKGLERDIAGLQAKKKELTDTRDSLLAKLESLKDLEKLTKETSEQTG